MAKRVDPSGASRPSKVTRDDLEREFRALQGGVRDKVEEKRSTLVTGAVVGGVLLAVVVFLLGRRSGRRKNTLVEIRRV